jgi:hypothetical protein
MKTNSQRNRLILFLGTAFHELSLLTINGSLTMVIAAAKPRRYRGDGKPPDPI